MFLPCNIFLFVALYISELCEGEVRYSEVRRLSALNYAHGHNIQRYLYPLNNTYNTRKPFQWNPGIKLSTPRSDDSYHQSVEADSVNPLSPLDVKQLEKKNGKRKRKKGNIWWPWASYEDWLANNERKDSERNIHAVLPSADEVTKKFKNSKKKKKPKRNKFLKKSPRSKKRPLNKIKYEHSNNEIQGKTSVFQIKDKETSKTKDSLSNNLGLTKFYSTLDSIQGSNKDVYINDRKSDNKLNSDEQKLIKKVLPPESLIDFKFSSNDIIKLSEKNGVSVIKEDNEIKKMYHSLPYWKDSFVETASRNYPADDNECLINNGGCEGLCINTKGSYRCHCPPGFRLDYTRTKCHDVDECLTRNGHGPCDGDCINTWGSFGCNCEGIPGTTLASDGTRCQPLDDCAAANCSHSCIPTRAGPFCTCPLGLQLSDDWKTCTDINECADVDSHTCNDSSHCFNTFGSFKCQPEF